MFLDIFCRYNQIVGFLFTDIPSLDIMNEHSTIEVVFVAFYKPQISLSISSINTLYRRCLSPFETFKGEMHDFWELVYIESGKLIVAEDERVYEMTAGQIVFHKPMEFHRFWCPRDKATNVIIISFDGEDELIQPLGDGVFDLGTELKNELVSLTDLIFDSFNVTGIGIEEHKEPRRIQEALCMLGLQTFLLHVLEYAGNRMEQSYNTTAVNYRKIITVMNEHIYENLSIEQIAAICCLGVSNLKKTFTMYAGCGVMYYFNNLKIIKAKELLKQGMNVGEVSDRLSYSSPNYFSLVFKKYVGKLPTEYRRNETN